MSTQTEKLDQDEMQNIVHGTPATGFCFNMGDNQSIARLQRDLAACGCRTDVIVHVEENASGDNVYYTPLYAVMLSMMESDKWTPLAEGIKYTAE